jgi:hypothetical protein
LNELGKQIGGLGNKFGSFTEGIGSPSINKILREKFGMGGFIAPQVRVRRGGVEEEYDIVAFSEDGFNRGMIVEIKSHLRKEDILQMKRKMKNVFRMIPTSSDKVFQGMIVCASGSEILKREVLENGWYLAHFGDDLVELETPPGFVAKSYSADG